MMICGCHLSTFYNHGFIVYATNGLLTDIPFSLIDVY